MADLDGLPPAPADDITDLLDRRNGEFGTLV
jgi:hypothetical protein